jgi:hypothetical protein
VSEIRFFEELGAELNRAARRALAPPTPSKPAGALARVRSLLRAILRGAPALLGVAVTLAVALGALLVIVHRRPAPSKPPSRPPIGRAPSGLLANPSPQQSREQKYIDSAWLATETRDPGCVPGKPKLTFSNAAPSAALLSGLGILRRSTGVTDLHPLLPFGLPLGDPVYSRYIRLARSQLLPAPVSPQRVSYYVVPAANVVGALPPSARCYAEQAAALRTLLPQIPEPLRASTLSLAQQERDEQQHPEGVAVQVVGIGNAGEANVDQYAATTAELEQRGAIGTGFQWRNALVVSGVVPDGVATVTLHYPAASNGGGTAGAFSVTTHPVNNVFVVRLPRTFGVAAPDETTWRADDGSVIKTIRGNS